MRRAFEPGVAPPRVVESWEAAVTGEVLKVNHKEGGPGGGLQESGSFLKGLRAEPFHDPSRYAWARHMEAVAPVVQEEFFRVTSNKKALEGGSSVWVAPARDEAVSYGQDWKTLVLQDRGRWEETNSKLFPATVKAVKESGCPTTEVFFARQPGGTGIKPHTDNTNYIMTSHLALQAPEGPCWIRVGSDKKEWVTGKMLVMDTSFIHETWNDTTEERYVLLMRHYHPETTREERIALQFIFDYVDYCDVTDEDRALAEASDLAKKALKKLNTGGAIKKGLGMGGGGGKGMGMGGGKGMGGGNGMGGSAAKAGGGAKVKAKVKVKVKAKAKAKAKKR